MKQRQWKRWTAALSAAAILLTPMATQAQSPDQETTQINHALTGTATANDTETNYWGADKAIDGIVNRDETNKQNQSRWSTNGARTFDQVAQKDKVLTVNMGSEQSFDQLVLEWERTNVTQFKIEAAGADQQYRTVYEKTDEAEISSLTTTIDLEQEETAQYVRLTVSGYTAGTIDWASVSLWELEILETVPVSEVGNEKPVVVPELAEWDGGKGDFTITDDTRLVVNPQYQTELQTAVTEFQADYKDVTGKTITVAEGTDPQAHDIYFTLGSSDTDLGEEGYLMKVTDSLTLEAVDAQGVYWGTRSVLQILSQNGDSIPQGTARDYPAYEVRGFMLDVGRKPISYEFLQTIVKEMAWYKMNDFQLHLNDNSFQKEYPNATVEIAKKAYSGFRLESTIKEGGLNQADLTSKDMYYTKDQMRSLIQECRALGIDIVPEFDTPAHSLALTKVRPDLIYEETLAGVDHLNLHTKYDETISFVQSIFNEYMTGANPVFDQDTIIHVGTDEYDEKYKEDFRKYTDDMLKFVQDSGRTVRLWGSLSMRPGSTPVRSEGVQMNVWNVGWANPNAMIQAGYDIINTDDTMLYIVPGVTRPGLVGPYYHDYLDTQWLYNNWNPTKFGSNVTVSADSEQLLGATFAVWNDKSGVHSNGITEQDIYDRFADALPALASKMWGKGKDLTYQELVAAVDEIGVAPNNNPTFQASSVDEQYLSYTFEPGQEAQDVTANGRDLTNLHNVETQYGTLKLLGDESYVETPLAKLGFGNTLEFDVTLTQEAQPGQILFEADSEYDTHDIRILDDGTLGYTTELYDYSFGYTLPVGKTVHLKVVSERENSALYVNGVRYDAVGRYSEEETGLNLTNIGYPSFVLPLQRIGSKTNAVVGLIDNVTVSVTPAVESKVESFSATSEYSGNPIANAFDGNTSTFWHSNWNPYEPLPASVTINLKGQQNVTGFTYLPRQDGNNNGQVTKYDLEYKVNADDAEWISLVKDGVWQANTQKKSATFEPVQASVIRFTAKAGTGDNANPAYACAAEFEVLCGDPVSTTLNMKAYADQGGTATVSPETATAGQSVTFTATAADGYRFDGWYSLTGEKVSDQATYTVEAQTSLTLVAKFQEDSGTETANKVLLQKTYDYAVTLSTEGVTDSAKVAFEKALTEAKNVLDNPNATQAEVNTAWDNLLEGIWGLGLTQGDKTMLEQLIAKADAMMADVDKYVDTNWQQLVDALAAAKKVAADGDAMDEDIQPAAEALLNAILAQRFKADKSILEDLITKAEGINLEGYTTESVATFRTALANAQAVMANADLSEDDQATVDAAVAALSDAMNGLTAGGAPETTDKPEASQAPETTDKPQSTEKPQATQKPENVPQTGDSAQLMVYVVALAAAAVLMGTTVVVRRRRS